MRVFISHTVRDLRDSGLAHRLAQRLGGLGINYFIAPASIRAGANWKRKIVEELSRCTHFFVIVSRASQDADSYVQTEIALARERTDSLAILQLVTGNLEPPFPELQLVQYCEDEAKQIDAIVAALRGKPPLAPATAVDPLTLRGAKPTTRTKLIAQLCDRRIQHDQFETAFKATVGGGLPQLYVVRGARLEAHDSLVDRLEQLVVRRYAVPRRISVKWPADVRRWRGSEAVLAEIFGAIDPAYLHDRALELTPAEWLRIASRCGAAIMVLDHELLSTGWSRGATAALEEYVEFWRGVAAASPRMPFVLFFNAVYDRSDGWLARRALRKAMDEVVRAARGGLLHAMLLDELQCVGPDDVTEWLREFAAGRDCEQHFRALFESTGCRRMGEVEVRLHQIMSGGNA